MKMAVFIGRLKIYKSFPYPGSLFLLKFSSRDEMVIQQFPWKWRHNDIFEDIAIQFL